MQLPCDKLKLERPGREAQQRAVFFGGGVAALVLLVHAAFRTQVALDLRCWAEGSDLNMVGGEMFPRDPLNIPLGYGLDMRRIGLPVIQRQPVLMDVHERTQQGAGPGLSQGKAADQAALGTGEFRVRHRLTSQAPQIPLQRRGNRCPAADPQSRRIGPARAARVCQQRRIRPVSGPLVTGKTGSYARTPEYRSGSQAPRSPG